MSRKKLLKAFSSEQTGEICHALVAMAFHDPDWKWSQDQCLHFLSNSEPEIRGLAATCLGHLARIHRCLDQERVEQALKAHLTDALIAGQVQDALDDIRQFILFEEDPAPINPTP